MRQLVENAGGELADGYLFKCARHLGVARGADTLGGRPLAWELVPDGVRVTHPPTAPGGELAAYPVALVAMALPSGGLRRWWRAPRAAGGLMRCTCGRDALRERRRAMGAR